MSQILCESSRNELEKNRNYKNKTKKSCNSRNSTVAWRKDHRQRMESDMDGYKGVAVQALYTQD